MKRDEQLSYLVICLAVVAFWVWVVPTQIAESSFASISPRTPPLIFSGAIFVLAAIGLATSIRTAESGFEISASNYRSLGLVTVALLASLLLAQVMPFWPAAIPTVLVGMWITGERRLTFVVPYTAGLITVTWVLVSLLGIRVR